MCRRTVLHEHNSVAKDALGDAYETGGQKERARQSLTEIESLNAPLVEHQRKATVAGRQFGGSDGEELGNHTVTQTLIITQLHDR